MLTLFRMVFFESVHGWVGGSGQPKSPYLILKICQPYPAKKVIPYLKKIQKICELRDTTLEFC